MLSETEEKLRTKTANSSERFERAFNKLTISIQKLGSIRSQLSSITNRVNALKELTNDNQRSKSQDIQSND